MQLAAGLAPSSATHSQCVHSCNLPADLLRPFPGADQIDKQTLEIAPADSETYDNLQDLADELPDHSPRYVLLSYPLTLVRYPGYAPADEFLTGRDADMEGRLTDMQPSGRLSVPYVLLYYLPVTCNAELRMLYAGAKELMRNTAEAGRVVELESAEELEKIEARLAGEQ